MSVCMCVYVRARARVCSLCVCVCARACMCVFCLCGCGCVGGMCAMSVCVSVCVYMDYVLLIFTRACVHSLIFRRILSKLGDTCNILQPIRSYRVYLIRV
jgi:hypothetical protein